MPSARSTIALAAWPGSPGTSPARRSLHGRSGQRLEEHRDEVALGRAPLRAAFEQLGTRQGDDVDRNALRPLEQVLDEVDRACIGPVQVLEDHDHRARPSQALEVGPPCGEELVGPERRAVPEQRQQRRFDPAPFGLVGHDRLDALGDLAPRRRFIVRLRQAGSTADHLAECPEGDALAVRRRAPVVPVDVLGHAVEVLRELPRQPALADPGRADDADQPGASFATGRVEQVLQESQFLVTADEGRLERMAPVPPATFGHDPDRAPGRHRGGLALERLLADRFVGDRRLGGAGGPLADEDGARDGNRLEAGGRVDEVARDHPLVGGAQRDRSFAGQDPRPGLDGRPESPDRIDQLERGTDAPFRVILVCYRRTPDGHDSVADELLDRPAISADDVGGDLEVAREHLADLLGIAFLGERREPDEIGEQDRHETAFAGRGRGSGSAGRAGLRRPSRRRRGRGGPRTVAQRRRALAAELRTRAVDRPARRAGSDQRRRALHAELGPGAVLRPARRAGHRAATHRFVIRITARVY